MCVFVSWPSYPLERGDFFRNSFIVLMCAVSLNVGEVGVYKCLSMVTIHLFLNLVTFARVMPKFVNISLLWSELSCYDAQCG